MGISNIQLNNAGLAAGARHGQTHYPTLHFVLSAAHWSVVLTLAIRSQQSKQPISCPFDMSRHLFEQHNQHPSDALNSGVHTARSHSFIPKISSRLASQRFIPLSLKRKRSTAFGLELDAHSAQDDGWEFVMDYLRTYGKYSLVCTRGRYRCAVDSSVCFFSHLL